MEGARGRVKVRFGHLGGGSLRASALKGPEFRWKRPVDVILGIAAALLTVPMMLAIAVSIWIDSGGPVLFRQERVGRNGAFFRMWKFRSMKAHSDDAPHRAAAQAWFAADRLPHGYKIQQDSRITRVGRLLRRTSLDELPQIFNVLRGEMSLVGPRPAIPYELRHYEPSYFERQVVKPGITGLWQVLGRDEIPAPEMMALDRRYVRECSLFLDIKILAFTLPALFGYRPRSL